MQRAGPALAAALVFNPALGTLYAWSLFLAPLEAGMQLTRAQTSAVFSTAVAGFMVGAVLAPAIFRWFRAAGLVLAAGMLSAAGLALAWLADGLPLLLLGYGAMFGIGSGAGYNTTLQLLNTALAARRGLATGLGVGGFAIGPTLYSMPLAWSIGAHGPAPTFAGMAAALLVASLTAALLVRRAAVALPEAPADGGRRPLGSAREPPFPVLWLGFCLAAACGVMTIGHAAGIIATRSEGIALAMAAVMAINLANAVGRVGAGALSDRLSPGHVGMLAHAVALGGFAILLFIDGVAAATLALVLQGLAYGIASGAYPAALGIYFGIHRFARFFGLLMTAWGLAGLLAPWAAGRLFDLTGRYDAVFWIGGGLSLVALAIAARIPRPARDR